MYDVRLNLSNQVVEEVSTHFKQMVFDTIIPEISGSAKPQVTENLHCIMMP
jgi:hypothetical protein